MRRHIKTVHEGHKDFKCKSCIKPFTLAGCLRAHIKNIHKGHKDFKCDSVNDFDINNFPHESHLKNWNACDLCEYF